MGDLVNQYSRLDNPLLKADNDLDWLELDSIPDKVFNPLIDTSSMIDIPDPVEEVVSHLVNPEYLHFAARILLNVELPPYQLVIIDTLWNKRSPMLIGTRGLAKSFLLAVYCLLRMCLEPGCKIVIVGNGMRQARQVFDYMARIWEGSAILRDIAGRGKTAGPHREIDRFKFELRESTCSAIPLGTGDTIRGLRANYIVADEFSSISEDVFNIVVRGFAVVAQDPIEKVKEHARIKRLKKDGLWNEDMQQSSSLRESRNQIIYSGTPFYQFNHFYKYFKRWEAIIKSRGDPDKLKEIFGEDPELIKSINWRDFAIVRVPYNYVPEGLLDPAIIAQAKASLTRTQFLLEYGGCFAADSDGFFRRSTIEAATTNKPVLVSGKLIQFTMMRTGSIDKRYVLGIDPAADADNAAIIVLELNNDHRKIVNCWTTNKAKYSQLKKRFKERGIEIDDDYYGHIARKIRQLMASFNIEKIIMDKNGGGTAVAEALGSKRNTPEGELPIFEEIIENDPKQTDEENGLHILRLLKPTNEMNAEANHGMAKDIQEKVLLFPLFDSIEMAKSSEIDDLNPSETESYEDLASEIEELKNEMTNIVNTPTSTGKENFNTPSVKGENSKKGRLRKDRYSALLYANYYSRNVSKEIQPTIQYKPIGGTKDNMVYNRENVKNQPLYQGPGIGRFQNSSWLTKNTVVKGKNRFG